MTTSRPTAAGLLVAALVGVASGAASAAFLTLLDLATSTRLTHPWLTWGLPVAGLLLGLTLDRLGEAARGGTSSVLGALHGGAVVSWLLAPVALLGTVLTHLFGGSAGREGTAVQMGGSLADTLSHGLGLGPDTRRQALIAGIAGGFGSVFGTPVAGAVFALEVGVRGQVASAGLVTALVASLLGDLTTRALGVGHTHYPQVVGHALSLDLLGRWLGLAVAVAVATRLFVLLLHGTQRVTEWIPWRPARLALGGASVVALWQATGRDELLGLGVPTILASFDARPLPLELPLLKLVATALTVGSGFLGGEVTPLFFVGATLGHVLAPHLGLPVPLAAGVGLAAVFASAAKAPLALSIMAVELLGPAVLPHVVVVCAVATWLSGRAGIYGGQREG